METTVDFALKYARAGYSVLPLRGKIPLTAHGSHDASTDEATIRAWWQRWPTACIGMTLEGLVVVDIDPRNGGAVNALPHELPDTCRADTGGGGLHFLYRAEPGVTYPGALANGVDQKAGPFAYIVVAPSLHASGRTYEWQDGTEPWAMQPTAAPDWIAQPQNFVRKAKAPDRMTRRPRAHNAGEWIVMDDDDIAPSLNPDAARMTFSARIEAELAG